LPVNNQIAKPAPGFSRKQTSKQTPKNQRQALAGNKNQNKLPKTSARL